VPGRNQLLTLSQNRLRSRVRLFRQATSLWLRRLSRTFFRHDYYEPAIPTARYPCPQRHPKVGVVGARCSGYPFKRGCDAALRRRRCLASPRKFLIFLPLSGVQRPRPNFNRKAKFGLPPRLRDPSHHRGPRGFTSGSILSKRSLNLSVSGLR